MALRSAFVIALLFLSAASAQIPEEAWKAKIATIRYPPLAEAERIMGDVRLTLQPHEVILISGHPALSATAVGAAKSLGAVQQQKDLALIFHFVQVDLAKDVTISRTVPRGNSFNRAILRLLGLKAEKMLAEYRCEEGIALPNRLEVSDGEVEIWVYGKIRCPQTNIETLVASR